MSLVSFGTAWGLSRDSEGWYLIATSKDLYEFAKIVNTGSISANAKLTADITVNENVLDENGNVNSGTFTQWTPIGDYNFDNDINYSINFSGTFDGQGHTIRGLYTDGSGWYIGLAGVAGNGAVIKNTGLEDSYFSSSNNFLGSFIGYVGRGASVTIANVFSTSTISGDNWIGGLAGSYGSGSVTIINSYFAGKTHSSWQYGTHHDDLAAGDDNISVVNTFHSGTSKYGTKIQDNITNEVSAAALHYYKDSLIDGSIWGFSNNRICFSKTLDVNVNIADITLHTFDGDKNTYSSKYVPGVKTALPVNVEREGYKFVGWYDNSELTGSAVTEIAESETGNKTYWAKFVKTHSVRFVIDSDREYSDYYIEGERKILPIPDYYYGYSRAFDGWYLEQDFSGLRVYFIPEYSVSNLTFYAKWSEDSKNVFYVMQDRHPENRITVYEGSNVVYLTYIIADKYYIYDEQETSVNNEGFTISESGFYNITITRNNDSSWNAWNASIKQVNITNEGFCLDDLFPDEKFRNLVEPQLKNSLNEITSLYADGETGIKDTEGLKYLTNLKYLDLHGNDIKAVDLSNNHDLVSMDLSGCNLHSIDLSSNTGLVWLNLSHNFLTSIDISSNTNLEYLNLFDNRLRDIKF